MSSKKRKKSVAVEAAFSDFITSRKAMNLTKQTIQSYNGTLKPFPSFCKNQGVTNLNDVDNFLIDAYFADMAEKGHSDGGMHAYYRSLRSFMRWAWSVYNFNSTCPTDISKVKSPPANPIPGIPESAVRDMLAEAEKTEYPMRDVSFIMFLVDTGVRKQEAANVKIKPTASSIKCPGNVPKRKRKEVVKFHDPRLEDERYWIMCWGGCSEPCSCSVSITNHEILCPIRNRNWFSQWVI